MPRSPEDLFVFLRELGIVVETVEHEAVFTVEQAKAVRGAHDGMHIKNLFLRNKKKQMWLVIVNEDRRIDLKQLATLLGAGHLSFGSPERLMQFLGVEPGSVTPFAVLNDDAAAVSVVLDQAVAEADVVHCHPLVNTMTTAIEVSGLRTFLSAIHHTPTIVNFDAVEP